MTVAACMHCEEPIEAAEVQVTMPDGRLLTLHQAVRGLHPECGLRLIVGSVTHVRGECACYIREAPDTDPIGMPRRQAARVAVLTYYSLHPEVLHP